VVASGDLLVDRQLISDCRAKGSSATWIVMCQPADEAALRRRLSDLERVGVAGVIDPVSDLLYVANEIAGSPGVQARRENRLLFGSMVTFRAAGSELDDHGFSYNVSPHGLYVRTLAPPVDDQVWLELCPPSTPRRVRLVGEVAWRRNFGRLGTETAPPGFGVRLTGGLGSDHDLWKQALHALSRERGLGPAAVPAPGPSPMELVHNIAVPSAVIIGDRPTGVAAAIADVIPAAPVDAGAVPADLDLVLKPVGNEVGASLEDLADEDTRIVTALGSSEPPALPAIGMPAPKVPTRSAADPDRSLPVRHRTGATGRVLLLLAALVLGLVVAVAIGGFFFIQRSEVLPTPAASLPRASMSIPRPRPEPAPVASASSAPAATDDGRTGQDLPTNEGYLVVTTSAPGDVYAAGIRAGATGRKIAFRCGLKFLRVGTEPGPVWTTAGKTVNIACQTVTTVALEPER
jgi:hypothetical protein